MEIIQAWGSDYPGFRRLLFGRGPLSRVSPPPSPAAHESARRPMCYGADGLSTTVVVIIVAAMPQWSRCRDTPHLAQVRWAN